MNPLVEALSKQRNGGDYGGDLHTRKDSHLSAPMQGMEWHLSTGDVNKPVDVNKTYLMCIPVICTSTDSHDVRFRQVGKPYVDDGPVFKGESQDGGSDPAKDNKQIPMVRMQSENVP